MENQGQQLDQLLTETIQNTWNNNVNGIQLEFETFPTDQTEILNITKHLLSVIISNSVERERDRKTIKQLEKELDQSQIILDSVDNSRIYLNGKSVIIIYKN